MSFDQGPKSPYHVLLTPPDAVERYVRALTTLLERVGEEGEISFDISDAIRNYGFGPCRVTQAIVSWDPARSRLGLAEFKVYAHTLALALECEMVDLWITPVGQVEMGQQMFSALLDRPLKTERLEQVLVAIKRQKSEAETARID